MRLIQKMAATGANCIYMMTLRSHGGDGDPTHNPFVDSDLEKPVSEIILDQWEKWFRVMDENGITIFLILYDDSSRPFGRDAANGKLERREADYVTTIVKRFRHHKHLIWCIAEEYSEALSREHVALIAERIRRLDPYHPIAVHQSQGTSFDFKGNPYVDQFAVQYNVATDAELHSGTVAAWKDVGGKVNVNMAEFDNAGGGGKLRKKLWAIALGGGYSMALNMNIVDTPLSDLETCGRLVRFMEATRFCEADPHDSLARGDTKYVLAAPGEVYIAYGDSGCSFGLQLRAGTYRVKWYDCISGDWKDEGSRVFATGEQYLEKPEALGPEAALYLFTGQ